jgi:hypothetical protein
MSAREQQENIPIVQVPNIATSLGTSLANPAFAVLRRREALTLSFPGGAGKHKPHGQMTDTGLRAPMWCMKSV